MNRFLALFRRRGFNAPSGSSRGVMRRLLARRSARIGILLAGLLAALTLIVPVVLPHRPDRISLDEKLVAPSIRHPLGTDQYGRDQLARIADGGRRSLGAALLVLGGTLVLSLSVGITVGMIGGHIDAAAMRVVDVLLALPSLVLALAVVGVQSGAGDDEVFQWVAGHRLEIVPQGSPASARRDGKLLPVQVLFDGEPAFNLRVSSGCVNLGGCCAAHTRTDEQGRAWVEVDAPGRWFIRAHRIRPHPDARLADWESFWASLTFQIHQ